MYKGFPDWMFAAFAIGGWELANLVAQHWHVPQIRWIGWGVVVACLVVLAVRYVRRFIDRRRHPEENHPDDWKNY